MKTVIEMAREAGLHEARKNPPYFGASVEALERLVELARADEREACAKVCEALPPVGESRQWERATLKDCAAAIRARGNT
jgi:hypothetical protein